MDILAAILGCVTNVKDGKTTLSPSVNAISARLTDGALGLAWEVWGAPYFQSRALAKEAEDNSAE
jgi:hypothetical protein